jgi:hypothetical protein
VRFGFGNLGFQILDFPIGETPLLLDLGGGLLAAPFLGTAVALGAAAPDFCSARSSSYVS